MPLPKDTEVHFVNSVDKASEMMRWLGERREVLAFDLETTGLNTRDTGAAIRLAQLGDYTQGWAIPWERWGGVFMEALDKYEGELTGHNTSFDNRWLVEHAGWTPPHHRLHDTMIMAQVCEPEAKGHGLKALGDRHVDRRASAGQKLLKSAFKEQGWDWDTVPVDFDIYWQYGCLDTIITAHLWKHYRADIHFPQAYSLEMATRRICSKMEDTGMPIDIDYCHEAMDTLEKKVIGAKKWAEDNWGINIGSSDQLAKFFTERLGQEIVTRTPSGAPSMAVAQMDIFAASENLQTAQTAKFVLDVRKAQKLSTTYFSNFISRNEGGVLHPSIKTMGARTGRMSVTNPALQTLNKGDSFVRDAFLARPDEVLVSCDYSQIEMRLMAHFADDAPLIEAFRKADEEGGDFFTLLGEQIYNDPNFQKSDSRRGLVKNTLYGANYGAGVAKMAESAGVPYSQMKPVYDSVFETYPGIKRFQKEIENIGIRRERSEGVGYVYLSDGRKMPTDEGFVYKLVNYLLQGTAAVLLKEALVRLDNAGFADSMLIPVHDEVVFSLPKEGLEDAMKEIQNAMSVTEGFRVPMPAEPEFIGERWGMKYR